MMIKPQEVHISADQLRKEKVQIARYATEVFSKLKHYNGADMPKASQDHDIAGVEISGSSGVKVSGGEFYGGNVISVTHAAKLLNALEYAIALLDDRELIRKTDELSLAKYHLRRLSFNKEINILFDDIIRTNLQTTVTSIGK